MSIDWSHLARLVADNQRFLLTTHVRPDGDALGSEVGLAGILRALGKDVRAVNSSPTPPRYDYLDPERSLFEHFASGPDLADREAIVILDLSSWGQLGDMAGFVRGFAGPRLVIDHHVSGDDLGAVVLKDTTAESTGTLVLRAAEALGVALDPLAATGLLTAIAMDTGWFRHPSTKPSTLRDAATLMEAGADVHDVYRRLFERSTPARVRLTGAVLSGLTISDDGRVAHAAVTRDDFAATGAIPPDTEDLIDHVIGIEGVEVAALFIEQLRGGGIKLSLRSRAGVDCSKLAATFGGGGHRAAAGATLPDPLSEIRPRVLAAIDAALDAREPAPTRGDRP